jgi:glutamine synthetase adenylyltransferase
MDFELPRRQDLEDSLRQQLLRIELDDVEDLMRVLRLFKNPMFWRLQLVMFWLKVR